MTPTPPTPAATPPKRRRWTRRLLLACACAAVLVVLLVLLAPTIATSRFAESRLSAELTRRLGMDVEVSGVDLGWRTPLRVERIAIGADGASRERPLAVVSSATAPLDLRGLLRGLPLSLEGLAIDSLEVNAVRNAEGAWNFQPLIDFANALEPSAEEPAQAPTAPSPLPVAALKIDVARIDIRCIDEAAGVVAGWENGSFAALWPGGANPLSADIAGDIRFGDARLPWDVRAKIEHWIGADAIVTPGDIVATIASDGMMNAGQIADGGFFLHADPAGESTVRVSVPLQAVAPLLAQADLPVALFDAAGEIELTVVATKRDDGVLDASLALSAGGFGDANLRMADRVVYLAPVDLAIGATGTAPAGMDGPVSIELDLAQRGALDLHATATGTASAPPSAFALEVESDFAELTRFAARLLHDTDATLATGDMTLSVRGSTADDTVRSDVAFDIRPGELLALHPFAEMPAAVPSVPLDLTPFSLAGAASVTAGLAEGSLAIETSSLKTPLAERLAVRASASGLRGELEWQARVDGDFDLATLFETARPFAVTPRIASATGTAALDVDVSGAQRAVETRGSLDLHDLVLALSEPAAEYAEPETTLAWDLSYEGESGALSIAKAGFANSMLTADATGTAGPSIDLKWSAGIDVDRTAEVAALFASLPGEAAGAVELSGSIAGAPGAELRGEVSLETTRDFAWRQEGLLAFETPLAVNGRFSADLSRAPVRSARIDIDEAGAGELMTLAAPLTASFAENGDIGFSAAIAANIAAVLGIVDPALWESAGLQLLTEGETTWKIDATANYDAATSAFAKPVVANIAIESVLPALEFAQGNLAGGLEEISDVHAIRIEVDPANPQAATVRDDWKLSVGYLALPFGAELAGLSATTALDRHSDGGVSIAFAPWTLDEGFVIGDTLGVFVPPLSLTGSIRSNAAFDRFAIDGLAFALEDIARFETTSTLDRTGNVFETDSAIVVEELSSLVDLVTFGDEASFVVPGVSGGIDVRAKLSGTMPAAASPPGAPVDARGTATVEFDSLGLDWNGVSVKELDSVLSFSTNEAGDAFEARLSGSAQSVSTDALAGSPPRDLSWDAGFGFGADGVASVDLREFAIGGYGTAVAGAATVRNVPAALAPQEGTALSRWLRTASIDANMRFAQDLAGVSGIVDGFSSGGAANMNATLRSIPGNRFELSALVDMQDASFDRSGAMRIEGVDGAWEFTKTILLSDESRAAVSLPPGRFTARHIVLGQPPLETHMSGATLTLQGFEEGLRMDAVVRDLLGGAATATGQLVSRDGDPSIVARIQTTGVDMRRFGGERDIEDDREAEINVVGDLRWRLRAVDGDRILEDLAVSFATTRIGRIAMARMLESLDPEGDTPSIQNALAALRLGKPVGAEGQMNTSLVSLGGELELPFGFRVGLPIVDRQPVSDLVEVYDLREAGGAMSALRRMLSLLLSKDLAEFESNLNAPEAGS